MRLNIEQSCGITCFRVSSLKSHARSNHIKTAWFLSLFNRCNLFITLLACFQQHHLSERKSQVLFFPTFFPGSFFLSCNVLLVAEENGIVLWIRRYLFWGKRSVFDGDWIWELWVCFIFFNDFFFMESLNFLNMWNFVIENFLCYAW